MKKTALYDQHVQLGAKMVPFAGFRMPVTYPGGMQKEYDAVRNQVGIFDVSHMGQFYITGEKAGEFLQYVTVNNVEKLKTGHAQYSAMCNETGGIIDDLIVYKLHHGYMMVVNAANIPKDLEWLRSHSYDGVKIADKSGEISLIAVQGPLSRKVLSRIVTGHESLSFYTFTHIDFHGKEILLSRTGYTGELGYEIYTDHETAREIWDLLLAEPEVSPAGLAVRDILRMEMKYCLYGNDIDETTNPIEAGLGWITDLNKGEFTGSEALKAVKENKPARRLVTFIMEERGIPRKDYEIIAAGEPVGTVTSGTQSLGLKQGIGIGYIRRDQAKAGTPIQINIRNKFVQARTVKPPFIKNTSLMD